MSRVIIFDPVSSVVPNRVVAHYPSADTPDFEGQPNTLVNPDVTAPGLFDFPFQYWAIAGSAVLLMDQATRDVVDAAEAQDQIDTDKASQKARYDADLKALALVLLDQVNVLRVEISTLRDFHGLAPLPARTPAQLRAAYDAKVDAG